MKNAFRLGMFGGMLLGFLYFLRRWMERGGFKLPPGGDGRGFGPPTFHFDPNVSRRVTVIAPDQKGRHLRVQARPLGPDPDSPPPAEKGIRELIATVINPDVSDMDTREAITSFDPPLVFTVSYDQADADRAGGATNLALATFYREKDIWRWQRLATVVDTVEMTLRSDVTTLTPLDPVGIVH